MVTVVSGCTGSLRAQCSHDDSRDSDAGHDHNETTSSSASGGKDPFDPLSQVSLCSSNGFPRRMRLALHQSRLVGSTATARSQGLDIGQRLSAKAIRPTRSRSINSSCIQANHDTEKEVPNTECQRLFVCRH